MSQEIDTFTLHITEAFPEDEGKYSCVINNNAGKVTTSATLKVHGMCEIIPV